MVFFRLFWWLQRRRNKTGDSCFTFNKKKEIYDAYYPNFVLKDDDYHVVSSNTISLIRALLLINRKKHILSNNKKQKTKTLTK